MKRVVKLSLVLLITICMIGSVYAALSCNVSLQASKTEVSKNEEFTVDVNIANIQSERGVISLGATLEYDKESLTLVRMEGQNGWETPANGASYNEANGKIAITRNGLGKNNETVFSIIFKVKEGSKQNLLITLKDITVADGVSPAKVATATRNITVKEGTANPVPTPDDGKTNTIVNNISNSLHNNKVNENTTSGQTNKNNVNKNTSKGNITTTKNSSALPKTGENTIILISAISILAIGAVIFFIKMKMTNNNK